MNSKVYIKRYILPVIVVAQFACTSLWFAGNAVISDIIKQFHLQPDALGHLVSAVQLGFISGTLLFAVFTISDRFSPSKIFFICAIAAALSNGFVFIANGLPGLMASRFVTGLFLAGIYPVGMKIAADYHNEGLGKALGYLVGALVIGTAFPHLVNGLTQSLSWKIVMAVSSVLSVLGGMLIFYFVPDGPHRTRNSQFDLSAFAKIFRNKDFRSAAFGYFGHMWELYAFWAFVPMIITTYANMHPGIHMEYSILAFLVIAIGGLACVMGGYLSQYFGSGKTAFGALAVSFICCLLSPFLFQASVPVFLILLFIWGMAVITDSPQFSTLVAQSAPPASKGTALTITNSIGFFITIISIEILNALRTVIDPKNMYLILSIGPLFGLIAMSRLVFKKELSAKV
jgi:predicted MFS family arabinose efflux permease